MQEFCQHMLAAPTEAKLFIFFFSFFGHKITFLVSSFSCSSTTTKFFRRNLSPWNRILLYSKMRFIRKSLDFFSFYLPLSHTDEARTVFLNGFDQSWKRFFLFKSSFIFFKNVFELRLILIQIILYLLLLGLCL